MFCSVKQSPLQLITATEIDDFTLLAPLGEGGAAAVHLARHQETGRLVAIKRSARARDGVLAHSLAEVAALRIIAAMQVPFLARFHCSLEDETHLYTTIVRFSILPTSGTQTNMHVSRTTTREAISSLTYRRLTVLTALGPDFMQASWLVPSRSSPFHTDLSLRRRHCASCTTPV
jgi:hypothetical protein